MRRRPAAALVASLVLLVLAIGVPGRQTGTRPPSRPGVARPKRPPQPARPPPGTHLASLPLGFEPNVGQAEPGVDFVARGPGYRLSLSPTEATVTLPDADGPLQMRLVGSNPSALPTGVESLPGRTNYLTGSDPSAWREDVPTFAKVAYDDVWPGIDLVFLGDQRRLRHDFVVAPGADPAAIAVDYPGSGPVTVDPTTGDLLAGGARLSAPVIYQDIDGRRLPVDGAFQLRGGARGRVHRRRLRPRPPARHRPHPRHVELPRRQRHRQRGRGRRRRRGQRLHRRVHRVVRPPHQQPPPEHAQPGRVGREVRRLRGQAQPRGHLPHLRHLPRRHQP